MDKKTLLAIALSMVVIGIGLFVQWKFFPAPVKTEQTQKAPEKETKKETTATIENTPNDWNFIAVDESSNEKTEELIKVETDLLDITFSSNGGNIQSFKLKDHKEKNGDPVEMIISSEKKKGAFNLSIGGDKQNFIKDNFRYVHKENTDVYSFYKDYIAENKISGEKRAFRLTKEYRFFPKEYLFELTVSLNTADGKPVPFTEGQALYALQFGPQLGPKFAKLTKGNNRTGEHRNFITFKQKKKTVKIPKKEHKKDIAERFSWVAVNGKYFSVAIIPASANFVYTFSDEALNGMDQTSQIFLSRMPESVASITDKYRVYIGPNTKSQLGKYNSTDDNKAGLMETKLDDLVSGGAILGWLENILMKLLVLFYKVVPNYGVAIILLTVFIKIILFPFTWKSFESTTKMQTLQPKIHELQAKFKEDPAKLNKEMADLYKREGVNPMGGCLPQLLQMPVLIALYGLLNRYFDLRGAMFIPGWIVDLSSPESIYSFNFTLPLVDISDLRLLPIIYLVIQLLTSLVMQGNNATPGSSNAQMKMMTYGMPLIFFFLFYNMPSGLLLYWTMTNVLTLAQQLITNRIKKFKKS